MEGNLIESASEPLDTGIESVVETLLEHCEPCHSKKLFIPSEFTAGDDIEPEASGVSKESAEKKRKKKLWDVPLRRNLPRRAKNRAIVLMTGVIHGIKIKRDIAIPRKRLRKRKIQKKIFLKKIFLKNLVRAKKIETRRAKAKKIETRRAKAKNIQARRRRIPESSDSSYSSYS